MDSYLCFDWPPKGDGLFVALSYMRGDPLLGVDKDEERVVPFMR